MPTERRRCNSWLGRFWDWVDRRQIDAWAVTIFTLVQIYRVDLWARGFAELHPDASAMVLAINGTWTAFSLAAIGFIFKARQGSFTPKEPT